MLQRNFLNNYNLVIKSIVVLDKHCVKINYLLIIKKGQAI